MRGHILRGAISWEKAVRQTPAYLTLTILFLIAIIPFIWACLNSVKTNDEILGKPFSPPARPQWGNFREAWVGGHLGIYFKNSVYISVPVVLFSVLVSSLAGYAFGKIRFWGSNAVFYLFLFGLTIPIQSIIIPLYYILLDLRVLDSPLGVILPSIGGPFGIFLMRAFFRQLPGELVDAGRIDGCTEFGVFWRIMLPLAKPAMVTLIIITFMGSWNDYLLPLVVLHSDANRTIPLGIVHFQQEYLTDYRLVFAAIVISFTPVIVLYIIFQRQFIQGIAGGALKG
ncbi:MAG: carbohydrate ABC transporter permease [bacterium]